MSTIQTRREHIIYEHDSGTVAIWHGGPYIDLGYFQDQGTPGINGDDFHAIDCINVWDYETGKARIAFTEAAMRACVNAKLAEEEEGS